MLLDQLCCAIYHPTPFLCVTKWGGKEEEQTGSLGLSILVWVQYSESTPSSCWVWQRCGSPLPETEWETPEEHFRHQRALARTRHLLRASGGCINAPSEQGGGPLQKGCAGGGAACICSCGGPRGRSPASVTSRWPSEDSCPQNLGFYVHTRPLCRRGPSAHSQGLIHRPPERRASENPLRWQGQWRFSVSQENSDNQSRQAWKILQLQTFPPPPPSSSSTLEHHPKHFPQPQSK